MEPLAPVRDARPRDSWRSLAARAWPQYVAAAAVYIALKVGRLQGKL